MVKRIAAISFIFACTTVAWMILGGTIFSRTYSAGDRLENKVAASWGSPQVQLPPTATYWVNRTHTEESMEHGQRISRQVTESVPVGVPVESSRVNVAIRLDPRQKGLLWYSTYAVDFSGAYGFRNSSAQDQSVSFQLKFPASQAVYDDLAIAVDGQPLPITTDSNGATVTATVPAGRVLPVTFSYRSQILQRGVGASRPKKARTRSGGVSATPTSGQPNTSQ